MAELPTETDTSPGERPRDGAEGLNQLVSRIERSTGVRRVVTSGKALVVDDDPDLLATVVEMLELHGFQVVTATDGSEAIAKAYEEKPDVILLDVMLPKMTGFEVCRRLKDPGAKHATDYDTRTPIVMLTAKQKGRDKQYAKSLGADAYLTKPFAPPKLYNTIEGVLNR